MWIATKHGFYSIVEKAPDVFHIRARKKKDLENLLKIMRINPPPIEVWPKADYRYRIIVNGSDAGHAVFRMVLNLDYSNFKSKIAATPDQREKLHAYGNLWHDLYDLQN